MPDALEQEDPAGCGSWLVDNAGLAKKKARCALSIEWVEWVEEAG